MQTATLVKMVRDPRSGQVHVPNEQVAILGVIQNLDRTLVRVKWEAGGYCVIFPDDVDERLSAQGDSQGCDESLHAIGTDH
jgi:hypothetical protein